MDKVFRVELATDKRRYCELELPASPYELLDALEKLQMPPGEKPEWEFIENHNFHFLDVHLSGECDLYQLNALATRLSELDNTGRIAFEGMFNQEVAKKYGPITIATMVDLAYSTDCCHVVEGVNTDTKLGEFYAENGFIPELESLPECVFCLLDFDKLGEKMRLEDGGILTNRGYVSHQSDLKQVYDTLTFVPKKPDYAVRLMIGRYPFETDGTPEKIMPLELPATQDKLAEALERSGAATWDEVVFLVEDCAIPRILEEMDYDGIDELNELAHAIKQRETRGELTKLKAVLHVANCSDISTATFVAETLDDYLFQLDQRSAEEVGLEELRFIVDSSALAVLQKHVNLSSYGTAVMEKDNSKLTPYGLVERRDGQSMQLAEEPGPEMVMM